MTHSTENLKSLMSQRGSGESIALTRRDPGLSNTDRDLNLRRLAS